MKKLLLLALLTFLLVGCGTSNPGNKSPDTQAVEKKVPNKLITCDSVYFERDEDGIAPDCKTFNGNKVCSYHTKEKNGIVKNETVQYDSACAACRFYGETGIREMGSTTFKHLGYIEGGCEGMIWE